MHPLRDAERQAIRALEDSLILECAAVHRNPHKRNHVLRAANYLSLLLQLLEETERTAEEWRSAYVKRNTEYLDLVKHATELDRTLNAVNREFNNTSWVT